MDTRKGKIRSSGKPSTRKADEGYWNEASQSEPLKSQSKPPSLKYSETHRGKTKKGLDKRGNKRSDMVLYVLQTAFYRK